MKKIKVMFKTTDKKLEMKIIDIHESFDELRGRGVIISIDDFSLQSIYSPELAYNTIFLPGTIPTDDYCPVSRVFEDNKERDAYIKKTNAIFAEWEKKVTK